MADSVVKAKFYEVVQALENGRFDEAIKITKDNCQVKEFVEAEDDRESDAEKCFMYRYRPIKRTGFNLLHYASLYSHIVMIRILIQHGADPLKTDQLGSTPLHYACLFGTEDYVKVLLSNTSEYFPDHCKKLVNLKNRVSWVPLYYAAERKNVNLVKLLLDYGADPTYKPSKKWQRTALHFIAKFSSPKCLAVVFKHGNCTDATGWKDKNGQTALHLVCEDDNLDAAKVLLNNDPSKCLQDVRDTEGRTALSLAIKHGAEKCAMHLLDITKVSLTKNGSSDYYDLDLLKEAITAERPSIVLHILEAYEKSLGYALPFGKSSMLYDIVQSDVYSDKEFTKIVSKLGKHCIEYSDEKTGWTPMLYAAQLNAHRKLEILLDSYTRILREGFFTPDKKSDERKSTYEHLMGGRDKKGFAAIHLAVMCDGPDIDFENTVKVLNRLRANDRVGSYAEINPLKLQDDKFKMTGMLLAVSLKKFNRALILLNITKGEGAEICDKSGSNLIHAAIQYKMPAVQFKKLLKLCMKPTKAESRHMRIEAAKRLLNKTTDDKHETALQMALKSQMHHHAQELIDFYDAPEGYDDTDDGPYQHGTQQGPDYIVDPTSMNESALVIAIDHGCPPEVIKKLLKRGCDPASTDDNNRLLVGVNEKTNLEHVKAILDWRYPAEYLNKLLETAVAAKRRDIVRLLLAQKVDVAQHIFTQVIVDSENEEYAMLLVRHTSSAESLVNHLSRTATWCPKDTECGQEQEQNVVLFHELIKRMPDVAEEALHRSVTISGTKDDSHYYANTKCLLNSIQDGSIGDVESGSATATLNYMVDHKELRLLQHPGVMYVLNSKWNEIGLPLYLAQLIAYLFLVIPLSVLVLLPTVFTDTKSHGYMLIAYLLAGVIVIITITLSISLVILLVRQKYRSLKVRHKRAKKTSFSKQLEKDCCPVLKNTNIVLQLVVFIFSILYSLLVIARTAKAGECCERASWHMGLFAIFLNWTNLIRLLSKLPTIGEHVIVFFDILWTFVKLTILGILLVLAATIVLMITFHNSQAQLSPFFTFRRGMVTVLTMIAGELDYLSAFGLSYAIVNDTTVQSTMEYSETAYFAWVIFLILVPILLSNMLIGLAVGDVIEIKKNAALRKLKQKVKLVSVAEDFLYGGAHKHTRTTSFGSCFSACVEALDKAAKWICIGEELSPQEKLVREKFLIYERKREAERKNGLPEGESLKNTRVEERVDDVRIVALSCEQKIKEAYDGTIKKLLKESEKLREEFQELRNNMNCA